MTFAPAIVHLSAPPKPPTDLGLLYTISFKKGNSFDSYFFPFFSNKYWKTFFPKKNLLFITMTYCCHTLSGIIKLNTPAENYIHTRKDPGKKLCLLSQTNRHVNLSS